MSTTTAMQPVPSVPSQPMKVDEFARTPEYDDNRGWSSGVIPQSNGRGRVAFPGWDCGNP